MSGKERNGQIKTCWIESFVNELQGVPSPELLLRWSAIVTVGAAMTRRVWATTANSAIFPNLFVLLVAPPGVGKSVGIRRALSLAAKSGKIKLAPSDMTKASLLDAMESSKEFEILSPTEVLEHTSLFLGLDELGTMLHSHDMSTMSVMNWLYDNNDTYVETRRGREEDLVLHNPQLAMLAGTQPDFLANLLPPEAWGMGFMSRMIMVFSGKPVKVDLFGSAPLRNLDHLADRLTRIGNLYGEMQWSKAAQERIVLWHDSGMEPLPSHAKLKHYNARRIINVIKLSMISSAARSETLLVDELDVERALNWLFEVEDLMPDIFKEMAGKGDDMVIQDLHEYLWRLSVTRNEEGKIEKKLIHRYKIEMFLQARTAAYNIRNIIDSMVKARMLEDKGGDMFYVGQRRELE